MVPQPNPPRGARRADPFRGVDTAALWDKLLAEASPAARKQIAWALKRRNAAPDPRLARAAQSKQEDLRELAMWLAGGMPWAAAADALRAGVADASARVRQAALLSIGGYKTDAAATMIAKAARSDSAETASAAVLVLKGFGERAVPALVELAADPRARARGQALLVLAALAPRKTPKALAAAMDALKSQDVEVRANACRLVGAVGTPAQAEALRPLKTDPDERVRRHAEAAVADLEAGPRSKPGG
jgi:HEAT repeat protein